MSFVKHAIFVDENAPALTSKDIGPYILNRLDVNELFLSRGVVDALDHSSDKFAVGGKLGIDCTAEEIKELNIKQISDTELLKKFKDISTDVKDLRQYYTNTKNPITIIAIEKNETQKDFFKKN